MKYNFEKCTTNPYELNINSVEFKGFYSLNENNELCESDSEVFCLYSLTRNGDHDSQLRFRSFRILTDFKIFMIVSRRSESIYTESREKFYIRNLYLNDLDKMVLQNVLELETTKNGK